MGESITTNGGITISTDGNGVHITHEHGPAETYLTESELHRFLADRAE